MIIVDSREPWQEVFDYLEGIDSPEYRLEALNAPDHPKADFVAGGGKVGIQRKEVNDFVGSLDTLKDDLFELREAHEMSVLLVEGGWMTSGDRIALDRGSSIEKTIPISTLHNFVMSQQLRGTLFIRTGSLEETVRTIVAMDDYVKSTRSAPVQKTEDPSVILQLIPGIGSEMAGRIADQYPTTYEALLHIGEWDDVDGIGESKKSRAISWFEQERVNV